MLTRSSGARILPVPFMITTRVPLVSAVLSLWLMLMAIAPAQVRDGGIDPWNLGKGDWIYYMSAATNKLGRNISAVTNENSLMLWYKAQGIRYLVIKAATSDELFNGSYSHPQFTSNLVAVAHTNGILVFGYNRSYGENVAGEVAITDYIFQQGADGFVWDAESEWESSQPWIGTEGPAKAWQLCSTVRSNWPTKFLAHAPFPIISYHTSFPYKEFGYWCDAVMPQIYTYGWSGVYGRPSGGINWSDVNWSNWQKSVANLAPTNINGLTVYWTNAIKPLAPVHHVYGPNPPNSGVSHIDDDFVTEFVDYLCADTHAVTPGGYKGANFWRADLHGAVQWTNISGTTIGSAFPKVSNIVIDDPSATRLGLWTAVRTFYNGSFYGGTTDTNSFGTNYLTIGKGSGSAYVRFTPKILVAGLYDVFQWHPMRLQASTNVPFVITHSAGTTTVYANQQTNSGRWSSLGRFEFAVGTNGSIKITDKIPESGAIAMVDGIKLVPVPATSGPAAASALSASAVSPTQINLAWTDNATNEAGFAICRATNSGGPYFEVGTVPANTTNFVNTGLTENTSYYYVVRAGNAAGVATNSNEAMASTPPVVALPPSIRTQPRSATVLTGTPASLSVQAAGTPALRYQWSFSGTNLPGRTSAGLSIASVQAGDTGMYSVSISNAYGVVVSSNALLSVISATAWGDNSFGQVTLPLTATNTIAIAAGAWHALALRVDGGIAAWGLNNEGQCDVPVAASDSLAIAAGGYHSLAITASGKITAWGANEHGQCSVPSALSGVLAVAAGTWHSLALLTDGSVVAWGDNTWGQATVPNGLGQVKAIAAGGNHSLALRADGSVTCWGENTDANGRFVGQSLTPEGLSSVAAVAAGDYHSVAVKADGTVLAWGDNSGSQCSVPAGLSNVVSVAAGGVHTLALRADGSVAGWGANWKGQLNFPAALSNAVAVATGHDNSLILLNESAPLCRLLNPSWRNGRFTTEIQTLNRTTYVLEYKDELGSATWLPLSGVPGNGALKMLTDPSAHQRTRFYRLRR